MDCIISFWISFRILSHWVVPDGATCKLSPSADTHTSHFSLSNRNNTVVITLSILQLSATQRSQLKIKRISELIVLKHVITETINKSVNT
jgi:hypothetical protein